MKIGYCAPACYIREVKEAGFDYIELPLCSIAAETDQSLSLIHISRLLMVPLA